MKVIYVAGPYRDPSQWEVEQNIRRAEELALEVWRTGLAVAICPHTLSRFYQGAAPDAIWLDGDMELLRRSDAILMTDDWHRSSGARHERAWAVDHHLPVLYSLVQMRRWLQGEWLMPHDKNGTLLAIGDRISVEATITAIQQTDEYCNLSAETVEPMYPTTAKTSLTFNTKQVAKVTPVTGAGENRTLSETEPAR